MGIDSKELLRQVMALLSDKGWTIGNIDSTICLQSPKVGPLIPDMISCLAVVMNIPAEDISIKATTTEKLGFVGKEEGIAAFATVLIQKI